MAWVCGGGTLWRCVGGSFVLQAFPAISTSACSGTLLLLLRSEKIAAEPWWEYLPVCLPTSGCRPCSTGKFITHWCVALILFLIVGDSCLCGSVLMLQHFLQTSIWWASLLTSCSLFVGLHLRQLPEHRLLLTEGCEGDALDHPDWHLQL